jgi:Flp pilus assembly protein TadB
MDFEAIWYEYTPYIYAVAGIMSILQIGSIIGIAFGIALIAAAGVIFIKRVNYRKRQSKKNERQMSSSR